MIKLLQINFKFSVRVRYAPSPTGMMHIGGIRTALWNQLFAKKQGGKFIVRIEDTDKQRQVEGSIENIFNTMNWLGIIPDQSIKHGGQYIPYIQSQRLKIYKSIQKQLLKSNKAYPCFCNQEHKSQQQYVYDRKCRKLTFQQIKLKIKSGQSYTVRIKSDLIQNPQIWKDLIFGQLQWKPFDDFIIVRSNGWPTFHFANVIDDADMKITHVLRGQQWISSTPKHLYLYNLFGKKPPQFAHLPLIKDIQGKKLSKRDPTSSAKFFTQKMYEPEAIKSYLATLGMKLIKQQQVKLNQVKKNKKNNQQKKQIQRQNKKKQKNLINLMSQQQMIKQFDLNRVSKSPVIFDIKQLNFLNRQEIKMKWKKAKNGDKTQLQYFLSNIKKQLPITSRFDQNYLEKALQIIVQRLYFISEFHNYYYLFQKPNFKLQKSLQDCASLHGKDTKLQINNQGKIILSNYQLNLITKSRKIIHNLHLLVSHVIPKQSKFKSQDIAKIISQFCFQSPELKNEDIYHMLRFMIIGTKNGPSITSICALLGRQQVQARILAFSQI